MSDREVFNSLERALSGDINDLQSLATRQLADVMQFLMAKRNTLLTGGAVDTQPRSVTGGLSIRSVGGGTQIELQVGFLGQFSTTWPAVPAALESAMRLGYNRSPLTLTLPGTPNQAVLLEAQVVDVVTLNTVRDVFDVPTQTFIPTAIDKRIERQIQTQFVEAAFPLLPGFSGNPWVPLFVFNTDGAGQTDLVTTGTNYDFRPDMQDILGGADQVRGTYSPIQDEGVVAQASLNTSRPGANGDTATGLATVGGNFAGRIGDQEFRFRDQAAAVVPFSASGFVLANNTIAHVYLLPLVASGIETAPWNMSAAGIASLRKGVLHLSSVQPANGGRVNSATITPNAAAFANFDAVPAGRAMYVGSVYGGTAAGLRYMTQSGAGRALLGVANPGNPLFEVVNFSFSPGAGGPIVVACNLEDIIPDGARLAILVINASWGSAAGDVMEVAVRPGTVSTAAVGRLATIDVQPPAGGVAIGSMVVDVPVFYEGAVDNDDKQLEIELTIPSAGNLTLTVDCIGWEL